MTNQGAQSGVPPARPVWRAWQHSWAVHSHSGCVHSAAHIWLLTGGTGPSTAGTARLKKTMTNLITKTRYLQPILKKKILSRLLFTSWRLDYWAYLTTVYLEHTEYINIYNYLQKSFHNRTIPIDQPSCSRPASDTNSRHASDKFGLRMKRFFSLSEILRYSSHGSTYFSDDIPTAVFSFCQYLDKWRTLCIEQSEL